jgi:hypothetical protein
VDATQPIALHPWRDQLLNVFGILKQIRLAIGIE